jgi:tetrahydromethanopterin S-methyltransferase subunit A
MIKVTIFFGSTNSITKNFAVGTTVGQVLKNESVRAGLGFGSNVVGHLCGAPQGDGVVLYDNAVLTVHNSECKKAIEA